MWPYLLTASVLIGAGAGVVTGLSKRGTPAPQHSVPVTRTPSVAAQFAASENTISVARIALTTGLDSLQGVPTVAAMVPVVSPYMGALQKYSADLAAIPWPENLAGASESLRAQVDAFAAFLQTLQGVRPLALGSWFSELHARAFAMTVAAVRLRSQLGLPS
ncbi:MAG TPA: hypothetical protein VND70_06265 [Acidimicrobiales bacterium]|nr:hypothetical protein [Acidimicrobiales bacterium]